MDSKTTLRSWSNPHSSSKISKQMKGIIIDYIEDKGFGFIMDENQEKRFFHISDIIERRKFLDNIPDYYFTDWIERTCYVVEFTPTENTKGLNVKDVKLTSQIFDERTKDLEFEARIVDVEYYVDSLTRTVSGIKNGMSDPIGSTAGSNGTFRMGYPEYVRELNIHFRRIDDIGWGTIDVRELALSINNRRSITNKFISTLKNKLVGKTVDMVLEKSQLMIKDSSILGM